MRYWTGRDYCLVVVIQECTRLSMSICNRPFFLGLLFIPLDTKWYIYPKISIWPVVYNGTLLCSLLNCVYQLKIFLQQIFVEEGNIVSFKEEGLYPLNSVNNILQKSSWFCICI